jgi:rhodanese-related sulfurtransferase
MKIRALVLPLVAGGMVMCALATPGAAQQPTGSPGGPSVAAAPPAPTEPPLITVDDVQKRLASGAKIVFVDARGSVDGEMVKGASHVPFGSVDAWAKDVKKDTLIVAYCACPTEGGSKAVGGRLIALGFTHVYALKGGIGAWKSAGLPTELASADAH